MKLLIMLLMVLSSFGAQANNNPAGVAPAAIKAFERTFSNANEVSWTIGDRMYKVSFEVAGQYATAYYGEDGQMLLVTRNISPLQLPMVLLASIKKDYAKQWIAELIEVSNENGTHYFITLEDANQKLILKSEGPDTWTRHSRIEK